MQRVWLTRFSGNPDIQWTHNFHTTRFDLVHQLAEKDAISELLPDLLRLLALHRQAQRVQPFRQLVESQRVGWFRAGHICSKLPAKAQNKKER